MQIGIGSENIRLDAMSAIYYPRPGASSRLRSQPRSAPTGIMCISCAGTIRREPTMAERVAQGTLTGRFAGQCAAYALARRLRSDERVVEVQIPAEVGAWNNVHQLRRRDQAGANHG
jgi:hypothetical protein